MEQKKVTKAEREVLKLMARVGTYINTGTYRRRMCSILAESELGVSLQFQPSTLHSLKLKGLLDERNEITRSGGEAAVKGYYYDRSTGTDGDSKPA